MATVVLQYAGAAMGSMLGGPLGSMIGRAAGAIAGNIIDQQLFGNGGTKRTHGPRLNDVRVMASEEGAPIPRIWGRMRLAGQVIWATNYEEVAVTTTQKTSSKGGGGGGGGSSKSKVTEYFYYANFAVGLCEGQIKRVGRVWADGKEIDLSQFTTRLYLGTEDQQPDSLVVAKEGQDQAPAYRGLAYIVFERMPLQAFGNRMPQLSFEVIGPAIGASQHIHAVNIIPGSTEFGYDTQIVTRSLGPGKTTSENAHVSGSNSDWTVALDELQGTCRNVKSASLVVAWFGTDLRCGQCQIKPGVDISDKNTAPYAWSVSGTVRAAAHQVSRIADRPAYGGTPSDASIIRAVQDLRRRGLSPVFYPFVLMDIPAGNNLADPYGSTSQAPYPWRGRLTCHPATGSAGTVDKTAAVTAQLQAFLGTAQPQHFQLSGGNVNYTGPAQWSYRRMILHYAKLCALAGGVSAFIIGSEFRGLTILRDASNQFPFVDALKILAAEVKVILPQAKVTYAADWSEYAGYHPADNSGDHYFHLDPLWASPAIDAIGIDNYFPVTDWRDGTVHLDRQAGYSSIYDQDYLQSRFSSGEGYDWYYVSPQDRDAQIRTAITDGAYHKPWVFRPKDLAGWWSNRHYNRVAGLELPQATAWAPQSKPIWFTEAGCPAIDKGANQPNAFGDAKSAESIVPYFSKGMRDDFMQASFLTALDSYWRKAGPHNPVSTIYGGPMLDADKIFIWAWDSRPFPVFPERLDVWSDGANFACGHWLNGRIGALSVPALAIAICQNYGLETVVSNAQSTLVDGYMLERPMSARDALENLLAAFALDAVESEGVLKLRNRAQSPVLQLAEDDFIETSATAPLYHVKRAQETELPNSLKLAYADPALDYRNAVVEAQKQRGASSRQQMVELPCTISQTIARQRAEILLQESWSGRENLSFVLPPSLMALEPGDVLQWGARQLRINHIEDGAYRKIEASSYEPAVYEPPPAYNRKANPYITPVFGKPDIVMMDLALAVTANPAAPWVAAQASPWPGQLALYKRSGSSSLSFNRTIEAQATMGVILTPLPAGPLHVFDRRNSFDVEMKYGALSLASELDVLNGENLAAIGDAATGFELVQFTTAVLIASETYRISGLLRGQAGSESEMLPQRAAGASFILLNAAVAQAESSLSEATGEATWRVGPARNDAAHPSYLDVMTGGGMRGLRPLSPCHLKLGKVNGGLQLSWIRRTRTEGDSWELQDVPLGEENESYQLQILNGNTVLRKIDVNSSSYFYPASAILQDFGGWPATISLRVAQRSATYGLGAISERIFYV